MALTAHFTSAWVPQAEKYLDNISVFGQALTNKNYEGVAKENATVKILSVGDVSESAYSGGWNDSDFANLSTTSQDFTLSQKRKFLFRVNDTDQLGSAIQLGNEGMKRALYTVMNTMDAHIASKQSGITTNVYGDDTTPISVGFDSGAGDVLPSVALSKLQSLLAAANADQSGPNVVVPVWFAEYLLQEFGAGRATAGGDAAASIGVTTGLLNFRTGGFSGIYVSNNVVNTASAKYKVMAGTPGSSITFAKAIDKIETGRIQNDFADFVKGLVVYGGLIPFEEHMALGTFNQGTARQ